MSNLVSEPNPAKRPGFKFQGTAAAWSEWADLHKRLGQELAKRMRVYPGPTIDPDGGDIGGTPAAMSARIAA